MGKNINLSTAKLSNDKLDVTSSRSKCLKEVDLVNSKLVDDKWEKRVTIEEKNVIGRNDNTVVKCINLSNDKLSNDKLSNDKLSNDKLDKLAANLLDSDSVVGVDDFIGIAKHESVGKVVVVKSTPA